MSRHILLFLGVFSVLTGIYVFIQPQAFYDLVPGLELMGPFSVHFIKDVGLAFVASGGAITWGAWHRNRAVVFAGIAWPFLHGLFHIQIWGMRGFPFDHIFFFDLFAVIIPPFIAVWAARRL